jgi:hypothetical protein
MLRFLVLLLLLANGGYFAWSQGMLKAYGYAPAEVAEPQRLAQQIKPEAIRVLRADEARRLEAATQAPARAPECLTAGGFDENQTQALRRILESNLPPGSWELDAATEPGRWIVYMGKYPSVQTLAAKRAELAQLNLKFEPLNNPALEPGLSLGGFPSKDAADSALAALSKRGVRTAKVLQEREDAKAWVLKLAAVDDVLRPKVEDLKPLLGGKPLRACR